MPLLALFYLFPLPSFLLALLYWTESYFYLKVHSSVNNFSVKSPKQNEDTAAFTVTDTDMTTKSKPQLTFIILAIANA